MDDAAGAVKESARILAPGGRFVASFVHPFASAHLGHEPAEQRGYFDVQRTVDTADRGGIAFTFHQVHRPLHAWTALFFDAGFVLEALREPRPSAQDALTHPGLAKTRARPAFLHVRCYQPEEGTTG
jgi:SAM-dependent methyltransferase